MEGYKKYGAFTILAWRTWKKRYEDFIESLKRPADIIMKEVLICPECKSINLYFSKRWNNWFCLDCEAKEIEPDTEFREKHSCDLDRLIEEYDQGNDTYNI